MFRRDKSGYSFSMQLVFLIILMIDSTYKILEVRIKYKYAYVVCHTARDIV